MQRGAELEQIGLGLITIDAELEQINVEVVWIIAIWCGLVPTDADEYKLIQLTSEVMQIWILILRPWV